MVCTACWTFPILNGIFPNNMNFVLGGMGTTLIPFFLTFKEGISFMEHYDFYYRHSKEYQDAYSSYSMLLEEMIKLFQRLNWDNEMKIFAGYSYLIKKGYLSLPHEFYYSNSIDNIKDLLGSNVILGEGNCKHINSMLRDLLRVSGYYAYNIGMNLDKKIVYLNDMLLKKREKISSPIDSNSEVEETKKHFLTRLIDYFDKNTDYIGNHLAIFIDRKDDSYIMDACNDTLFFVDCQKNIYQNGYIFSISKSKKIISYINYGEDVKMRNLLKPTSETIMNQISSDYYGVWNSCYDYNDTFEKFYQEHKYVYEEIIDKRKILKREWDKWNISKNI